MHYNATRACQRHGGWAGGQTTPVLRTGAWLVRAESVYRGQRATPPLPLLLRQNSLASAAFLRLERRWFCFISCVAAYWRATFWLSDGSQDDVPGHPAGGRGGLACGMPRPLGGGCCRWRALRAGARQAGMCGGRETTTITRRADQARAAAACAPPASAFASSSAWRRRGMAGASVGQAKARRAAWRMLAAFASTALCSTLLLLLNLSHR